MEPKINQKVKIIDEGMYYFGTIQKIFPPCEDHSGRIIVHIPARAPHYREFWYSDLGKTLILVDK
jgi:hypothetical protein